MDKGTRIAVLISGRGSNCQALAEGVQDGRIQQGVIQWVISNRAEAEGLIKAEQMGLSTKIIQPRNFDSREAFDRDLAHFLTEEGITLVCLAGFMRILTGAFREHFPFRIMNIHPSLLPAFPGLEVQKQALEYGVRVSGCTVHFVTEEVDAGPIILQAVVPIEQDDTPAILAARILKEEHRIYPQAVDLFCRDKLRVEGRRVCIEDAKDWQRVEARI